MALLKIAEIAQNDLKQASILSQLFQKYPETRSNPRYQQQFFRNAAFILPDQAEPYLMTLENSIPLEYKILSQFVLAAGFMGTGNLEKARDYFERGNHLVEQSLSDTTLKKERFLSQVAELNTFLVYRLQGKEAAYETLQRELQWDNNQEFSDKIKNIRKKLDVLGKSAPYERDRHGQLWHLLDPDVFAHR